MQDRPGSEGLWLSGGAGKVGVTYQSVEADLRHEHRHSNDPALPGLEQDRHGGLDPAKQSAVEVQLPDEGGLLLHLTGAPHGGLYFCRVTDLGDGWSA